MSHSSAQSPGNRMRAAVLQGDITPFIGVYDVFSAGLTGRHYDALFLSGFGFAASFYGLPDIGFITWSDMVAYVQRIRTILPAHHLLVDIDDGYTDPGTWPATSFRFSKLQVLPVLCSKIKNVLADAAISMASKSWIWTNIWTSFGKSWPPVVIFS